MVGSNNLQKGPSLLEVGPDFIVGEHAIGVCIREFECILHVEKFIPATKFAEHVVVASLEVIGDLELVSLAGDFGFHFRVGVVDDS